MITSKTKRIALIGASLLTTVLAACSAPVTTSQEEARNVTDSLTYAKDKHGVCYAVLGSFNGHLTVNSIASVPCDAVGL